MAQGRAKWVLIGFVAFLESVFQGCAQERGVDSIEPIQSLFVGMNPSSPKYESYILSIDPTTYAIVDSFHQPTWTAQLLPFYASSGTPRLAIEEGGKHRILDVTSNMMIASLGHAYNPVLFLPDLGLLLGAKEDSVYVYEDTAYSLRKAIPHEMFGCRRLGHGSRIIGLRNHVIEGVTYPSLLVYDLHTQQLIDSILIDPLGDGSGFSFADFNVSPDGQYVYVVGADRTGQWVIGFNLASHSVTFKRPKLGNNPGASVNVSPNGKELWVTWGWNALFLPWPEWVHVLDAQSGMAIDSIDVRSEAIGWPRRVSPSEIVFSRDIPRAFIACGTGFTGTQPLIVVDVETHRVAHTLFPNADRIPRRLAIGTSSHR